MMTRKHHGLQLLLCCSLLMLGAAFSQDTGQVVPQGTTTWAGNSELRVVGGYSPFSTHLIGVTDNRKLAYSALEYEFPLTHLGGMNISYYGGVVPFIAVHKPAETVNGTPFPSALNWGGGVEPIGFSFKFRNTSKLQPYLETAGGVLYFNDQVPIADSSQFNFMFHFGGGLALYRSGTHFLSVGYRYHHISNANLGHFNPGIDSNIFYIAAPLWHRTRIH